MAQNEKNVLKHVIGNWGLGFEILSKLVNAMMDAGGDIEELRLFLKRSNVVHDVVNRIMHNGTGNFRAEVNYTTPKFRPRNNPEFDEISEGVISADFTPLEVCKDVSRIPRQVWFGYLQLPQNAGVRSLLTVMKALYMRPAVYEELLAFAAAYPNEQRKFRIIALGSNGSVGNEPHAAILDSREGGQRVLTSDYYWGRGDGVWNWYEHFLVVFGEVEEEK